MNTQAFAIRNIEHRFLVVNEVLFESLSELVVGKTGPMTFLRERILPTHKVDGSF